MKRSWAMACAMGCVMPAMAAPPAVHALKLGPQAHAAAGQSATMLYYAGPVIASVRTVAVMWGTHVNPITVKRIPGFLGAIANSTFVDQLAQYSTHLTGVNGRQGTNQTIGRGTFGGEYVIKPANTARRLSDAEVTAELQAQIAAGHLPKQDLNTLYLIYFPRSITITLGGGASCQSFGAYHEAVSASVTPDNIFYAVEPDCGGGFATQTIVSSHEFAEAVTDAIPTPGSNPAYPQAWNTSNGYEIGDLCGGTQSTLTAGKTVYQVQEVFDNAHGACATGKFTSP